MTNACLNLKCTQNNHYKKLKLNNAATDLAANIAHLLKHYDAWVQHGINKIKIFQYTKYYYTLYKEYMVREWKNA